ncbi:type I restriction enzyme EcoEI M protein HsdM [Methyloglobulus morosus KoM1]|uniref:site-specific DNA-methyltransferase (adenine-specific) n=1 Tax=Methyloglobulus morosus KoM1 TaxID=1116472 RepID=V5C4K2_9GAMM|nr:type I restriction-modification system subunit M [Methyloglobulus morosus]ESS71668.1 type I restriction enzyme EcoEI M protein HsdM [Methyloglobulus morosus KoM1]
MLQNNPTLKSKIDQLWNKFWSGGISNPLTAIEQITYLLFMKRLDDLDLKQQADAEFTGDSFTSRFSGEWIPSEHRDKIPEEQKPFAVDKHALRWSEFKHMSADHMLSHVQTKVFPFLKDINGQASCFTHHMKNAVFIIPKPMLLVEAVKTIDEMYAEMEKDSQDKGQAFQDIQGDVYEYLLSEIASAGKNGQFRTPRHIIKLMAELVQPQLGHRIADPACGSGGFLLGAYQYIVTQLAIKAAKNNDSSAAHLQTDEDGFKRTSVSASLTENAKNILNESLWGYDIDSTMVRLGLMNLMMHGIDEPHIDYKDTLSKSFDEASQYDIVMANPPFTGSIDKGDINESLKLGTTKTELLFIENIYRLLKKGGTAAVIVPQGVLFGSGNAFVAARKILVDSCDLKAVITLPSGVFRPYAGVSTAILIFTKVYDQLDKVDQPTTQQVWFYDMQSDGYSLDDKRNKLDGHGDLQDIVANYHSRQTEQATDRTQRHFTVPRQEIVDENYDLSLSRYKEDVFEEIHYDKPEVILHRLLVSEVGEDFDVQELGKIHGGIVKELLTLKGMIN